MNGNFNSFDPTIISYLINRTGGTYDYSSIQGTLNQALPPDYQAVLFDGLRKDGVTAAAGDNVSPSPVTKTGYLPAFLPPSFYQDRNDPNLRHYIFLAPASNASTCLAGNSITDADGSSVGYLSADGTKLYPLDANGVPINDQFRDGALQGGVGQNGTGTGVIAGTPTGIITNSTIDQTATGGAIQFNWNLEKHKVMVGISADKARASYNGTQRFGLLDDSRNVYSDPDNIGAEYYAKDHDITINDFDGSSLTKSVYFSETWSPIETLNFSFSSRYNYTDITNNLAPASRNYSLANFLNKYAFAAICPDGVCPFDPSKPLSPEDYAKYVGVGGGMPPTILASQKEKFSYHSLNPSIGVTWQATPRLNLYSNWNQGTRVPSVIELGCAYEGQLVPNGTDNQGNPIYTPQSVRTGRQCSLPNALSGDPYLPQVVAQTFEVGARGKFKDLLEWNISAYQTNLKDDIYLVSATSELSYFQSIGKTRRRGIEFGLAGAYGRSDFRANYSLTEATFQSALKILSANNSSTLSNVVGSPLYNNIQINPGDYMPGIPLNNLNFSWSYKITPALKVSLGMVAHSGSFLRGNENNAHTPGPSKGIQVQTGQADTNGNAIYQTIPTPDYQYDGRAPGYAVLNLRTTYDLGKGWSLGAMVNNLLDKKYYSAGRLGLNPFSPSVNGAIGPGGFNYNSSEWQSTQFISAGAPRGVWFTLAYDFDASRKYEAASSRTTVTEPDRTVLPSTPLPTPEELSVQKAMDATKALPVLKRNLADSTHANPVAEQEITAVIDSWKNAQSNGDAAAYLQHYSPAYAAESMTRQAWEESAKLHMTSADKPVVEISDMLIAPQGKHMTAFFTQSYRTKNETVVTSRILYLEQQNGHWLITREQTSPATLNAHTAETTPEPVRKTMNNTISTSATTSEHVYAEVK